MNSHISLSIESWLLIEVNFHWLLRFYKYFLVCSLFNRMWCVDTGKCLQVFSGHQKWIV